MMLIVVESVIVDEVVLDAVIVDAFVVDAVSTVVDKKVESTVLLMMSS